MGKDEGRKKSKAASAARAGELLASCPNSIAGAGVGFGGFMGSQSLAEVRASTTADSTSANEASGFLNLDGEVSLHLRRLSKRDATTKLKALQALHELVKQKPAADLESLLPAWCHTYQRLVLDNSRAVREEAAEVLGAIVAGVGSGLAPFLKQMVGPWVLAQHDLQPEVARAAKAGFEGALPGPKSRNALKLYQTKVLDYLSENLGAAPEVLGDPQRESPEELRERHERVVASSLLAVGLFSELVDSSTGGDDQLLSKLQRLLGQPGFYKKSVASKSPVVRRAAYRLLSTLASRCPSVLEPHVTEVAPSVFGAFGDKYPGTHGELWGMVLAFAKAFPAAWQVVDVRKVVVPKLLAFLRNGCYGSAQSSFPALYPFLTLLPKDLVAPDVRHTQQILDAVLVAWGAMAGAAGPGSGEAAAAAAAAFEECWAFAVSRAAQSEGDAEPAKAVRGLGECPLTSRLLPLALSRAQDVSEAALNLLSSSLRASAKPRPNSVAQPTAILLDALKAGTLQQLNATLAAEKEGGKQPQDHIFERTAALLEALEVSAGVGAPVVSEVIAAPILELVSQHPGGKGISAARLLAKLIRRFGSGDKIGTTAASLLEAQQGFLKLSSDDSAAPAHADILLACMSGSASPAAALVDTLSGILQQASAERFRQASLVLCRLRDAQLDKEAAPDAGGTHGGGLRAWQSQELDAIAQDLVSKHLCSGLAGAGELLGLFLLGDSSASLLSATAAAALVTQMQRLAVEAGDSFLQKLPALRSCLQGCLFSAPLWSDLAVAQGSPALELLTGVFRLALKGDPDAGAIWNSCHHVRDLRGFLPELPRAALDQRLVLTVRQELQFWLEATEFDDSLQNLATAVVQLHTTLDGTDVLGSVLSAAAPQWPCFVSLELGCVTGSGTSAQPSPAATRMTALAAAVCAGLGVQEFCAEGSRAWLAADLLCWSAAGEEAAELLHEDLKAFLVNPALPAEASSGDSLLGVAERLWSKFPEGQAVEAVRAAVLSSLIEAQLCAEERDSSGGGDRLPTFQKLLRKWTEGSSEQQLPFPETERAFSLLVKRLREARDEAAIRAAGLAEFSLKRIRTAAEQQPLWQALAFEPRQAQNSLECLHSLAVCFPVAIMGTADTLLATDSERQELAAVVERQLAGERSAEASLAASRRVQADASSLSADASRGDMSQKAETVHGALLASAATYCWSQLKPVTQQQLVRRVCRGVQAATVALEEAAEKLSGAAVGAARRLAADRGSNVAPASAIGVLWQMQGGLFGRAAHIFQDAMEGVENVLADEAAVAALGSAPTAWLEACAITLARTVAPDESIELPEASAALLADALRCLLCQGIVGSLAQAAGEGAKLLFEHWAADLAPLVAATAACCRPALARPLQLREACRAADMWAEDTGVDAVAASLALLTSPHPAARKLALHSLLQPEVLSRVADKVDDEGEEAGAERQAAPETAHDHAALLTAAGLRVEVAEALVSGPPRVRGSEEEAEEGDGWLLVWAVLLAYLLQTPPESPGRSRLLQAIHDTHRLVPALCSYLVPLLPLESATRTGKPQASSARVLPVRAAAVAAEARAAGNLSEAVSWTLSAALRAPEELRATVLAPDIYRVLLRVLPASARSWFQEIRDKKLAEAVQAYTAERESWQIIVDELAGVSGRAAHGEMTDAGSIEFSVRAKPASREAVALVTLEDSAVLELSIQLPSTWPLHDAKVDCRKKMGVAESRLRKWMLSITALLRSQNGALSDAINLWQRNCARQFAGVEECLICYNVILANTGELPKLACRTCSKRYHPGCLYKWFRSSSKSVCPHCQSAW